MIQFTPDEFQTRCARPSPAAHLSLPGRRPLLKAAAHRPEQRPAQLTHLQRSAGRAEGSTSSLLITHRENRDPESEAAAPPNKLADIDVRAMRDELENVSALVLPDLLYQMVCALGELPMYHNLITSEPLTTHRAAQLMAWTWEAGRRYGLQQALAITTAPSTNSRPTPEPCCVRR